jgi:hypothetical protein
MSLLRFYPGATPGEKRKQIENDDEKQKKKQEYEKNRPVRKFSSKWQTERPWLVFNKENNMMTCTTCIEFFQSDKISNSFISGCSNLRASAVTDHEQSKTHMKAIVPLNAMGKSTTENGI